MVVVSVALAVPLSVMPVGRRPFVRNHRIFPWHSWGAPLLFAQTTSTDAPLCQLRIFDISAHRGSRNLTFGARPCWKPAAAGRAGAAQKKLSPGCRSETGLRRSGRRRNPGRDGHAWEGGRSRTPASRAGVTPKGLQAGLQPPPARGLPIHARRKPRVFKIECNPPSMPRNTGSCRA